MTEPNSRYWISQGLKLHYLDWGNEDTPLLILLHGNCDHAHNWDWTARELCRDWHVIAPDFRGHGDSAWSPDGAYLTPYHVADLADLVDHLTAGNVSMIGHSFGGVVSLRYASLFPDRVEKLINVDGFGPGQNVISKWKAEGPLVRSREWIAKRRRYQARKPRQLKSIEDAFLRLSRDKSRLTEERARHLARYAVRPEGDGYVWKYDPQVKVFGPEDFLFEDGPGWAGITCPTLFMFATGSWKMPDFEKDILPHIPHAEQTVFEDCGHWIQHDQYELFIERVKEFLS